MNAKRRQQENKEREKNSAPPNEVKSDAPLSPLPTNVFSSKRSLKDDSSGPAKKIKFDETLYDFPSTSQFVDKNIADPVTKTMFENPIEAISMESVDVEDTEEDTYNIEVLDEYGTEVQIIDDDTGPGYPKNSYLVLHESYNDPPYVPDDEPNKSKFTYSSDEEILKRKNKNIGKKVVKKPTPPNAKGIAIYDYEIQSRNRDVALKKGETFEILDSTPKKKWKILKNDGTIGYVLSSCIKIVLRDTEKPLTMQ